MTVVIKILQLILALSVLILIHEAGHFMWARIFGIRVDKFFLFFDIGGKKLFSTRMGWFLRLFPSAASWKTEYGIGWLPLGGYCKISGMVDESMDMESLKGEPQAWEFRSKPAWQRLFVMAGGVVNNFILAIALFCVILGIWGKDYISASHPIYVNEVGESLGFRSGDRILLFDDYAPQDFTELQSSLARRRVSKAVVLRGADTLELYMDQALMGAVVSTPGVFDVAVDFVVDSVMAFSPNHGVLLRGDRVVAVDSVSTPYLQDAQKILRSRPSSVVPVSVARARATSVVPEALPSSATPPSSAVPVTPSSSSGPATPPSSAVPVLPGADTLVLPLQTDSLGMLGVYPVVDFYEHLSYSALECIPAGFALSWDSVAGYLQDLRLVATPSTGAYKSVGSFIAIGQIFPSAWDWHRFLYILAMLSIMLGVLNLLPVPALDGGHIVFCLYEMVSGRKPSDRFLAVAQMIGMLLLVLLMLLAFGNDFARLLH